jgi:hypothetical protein
MMPIAVKVLRPRSRKVGAKWICTGILLWLIAGISATQELPSGGGAIPALRRDAGGENVVISALVAVIAPPNLRAGED